MLVKIGKYPGRRSKKERKVEVRIDDFDCWSLDDTLAMIIHPALLKLQENKNGSPFVDEADVPEHLRNGATRDKWGGDDDPLCHDRWTWVLGEMVWAFGEIVKDDWEDQFHTGEIDMQWIPIEGTKHSEMIRGPRDTHAFDRDGWQAHYDRIRNGTTLFGKYFQGLWD